MLAVTCSIVATLVIQFAAVYQEPTPAETTPPAPPTAVVEQPAHATADGTAQPVPDDKPAEPPAEDATEPAPMAEPDAAPIETPVPAARAIPAPDLSGSWCGTWSSTCTGHHGPLKATFCKLDACRYEVHFRGRFCKLIPFCYTTTLRVTGTQNGWVFLQGSHKLGPIMGTFSYNARASDCQFAAGYRAKDDVGQFIMTRVSR
jgi:hypothetical protein